VIAAVLTEDETIDREQFGRLPQSWPGESLALHPAQGRQQPPRWRERRMSPAAAGAAKHLPSALAVYAVQPDDLKPHALKG
jgi:hypothetical protein